MSDEVLRAMTGVDVKIVPKPEHGFCYLAQQDARRVLRAALNAAGLRGYRTLDMGFGGEAQALDCDDPKAVLTRLADAAGMNETTHAD